MIKAFISLMSDPVNLIEEKDGLIYCYMDKLEPSSRYVQFTAYTSVSLTTDHWNI